MLNQKPGAKATRSGKMWEEVVEAMLRGTMGFKVLTYKEYEKSLFEDNIPSRCLVKKVPYMNIYGSKRSKSEYLLIADDLLPTNEFPDVKGGIKIRIECKYQQVSGSVDEKFPFFYLNALYMVPENNILFLHEGDGYREGSIEWLTIASIKKSFQKVDDDTDISQKNIQLMDVKAFMKWVRNSMN